MRWLLLFFMWRASAVLLAQDSPYPATALAAPSATLPASGSASQIPAPLAPPGPLPDAPGPSPTFRQSVSVTTSGGKLSPCPAMDTTGAVVTTSVKPVLCTPSENSSPYQRFLNSPTPFPLSSRQKVLLAVHDVVDPANLFTIAANAAFTIGIDSHTGYGPGLKGFGRDIGYTLVQDATGEFFATYVIDSLLHEDPHYHRSPQASVPRRFVHAISHTVRSRHDDGTPMPNYSTLLTYPISAEVSNLYVPGVHGNAASTVKRVAIGLASNPIDDLITEFLPDFAKRVHVRVIFVQQILNNVASGQPL